MGSPASTAQRLHKAPLNPMTIKSLTHSPQPPPAQGINNDKGEKERCSYLPSLPFLFPPPLRSYYSSVASTLLSLFVGIPHPLLSVWPSLWKRTSRPCASCPTAVLADSTFTNFPNVPIGIESILCEEEHAQGNNINRITRPLE